MAKEVQQSATVVWTGTVARGSGEVRGATGFLGPLAVDLPNRIGDAHDKTTPEELLAAAHATCFATALGSVLAGRKTPPERLEVTATVTLELGAERASIPVIRLEASGDVPGLDETGFAEAVKESEEKCLISRVLTQGTKVEASVRPR